MRKIYTLCLLVLAGFFAAAQTQKGTAAITIISGQGIGLEGATVEIVRGKDSVMVRTAITDKKGEALAENLFDVVVDPASVARGKPAPDIFLAAAAALGTTPPATLGVEDSLAGLTAIQAAGMPSLGVGDPATLAGADRVIPAIAAFDLADYRA